MATAVRRDYARDVSEAFRFLDGGGDLLDRQDLNYEPFLPFLVSTFGRDAVPAFLERYESLQDVDSYFALDDRVLLYTARTELACASQATPAAQAAAAVKDDSVLHEFEIGDCLAKAKAVIRELAKLIAIFQQTEAEADEKQLYAPLLTTPLFRDEVGALLAVVLVKVEAVMSFEDVILALAMVFSPELVITVVANHPSEFISVISVLFSASDHSGARLHSHICDAVMLMCELAPHQAAVVRDMATESQRMPELAIALTKEYCEDELVYMNSVLSADASWLWKARAGLRSPLEGIKTKLLAGLTAQMASESSDDLELGMILRVLCGLAGMLEIEFSFMELDLLLAVGSYCEKSERLTNLFVSLCLICSKTLVKDLRASLVTSLSSVIRSTHAEMILLLAVYFHTDQHSRAEDFVQGVLGIDVHIPPKGLDEIGKLFTGVLLSDDILALQAMKLSLSKLDHQLMDGALALVAFCEIMRGGVFHRANADISSWIHENILTVQHPYVHPLMVTLIKEYVQSTFETQHSVKRLTATQILKPFNSTVVSGRGGMKIGPCQALTLFYVLRYNSCAFTNREQIGKSTAFEEYGASLLHSLPIRRIMNHVAAPENREAYRALYPDLLALAVAQLPHLFDVTSFLQEEKRSARDETTGAHSAAFSSHNLPGGSRDLEDAIRNVLRDPDRAIRAPFFPSFLRFLNCQHSEVLLRHWESLVTCLLPSVLGPRVTRDALDGVAELWAALSAILSTDLWVLTVNLLLPTSKGGVKDWRTLEDLLCDPMVVFRCDWRIFRCPSLFEILLCILRSLTVASRHYMKRRYQVAAADNNALQFSELHLKAALYIQDSLIVQSLLEVCLESAEDRRNPDILADIRDATCNFLHQQLFVEIVLLLKLLMFQTFPEELIPVVVEGVPSLYVCLDHLPELLTVPDEKKRIFGIQLAGYLFNKYPMPSSLHIAQSSVVPTVREMLFTGAAEGVVESLISVVPTVEALARAFPLALGKQATDILLDIEGIVEGAEGPVATRLRDEAAAALKCIGAR